MSRIVITINTDNAAFQDDWGSEVRMLLTELATKFGRIESPFPLTLKLYDTNGNVVGKAKVTR